MKCTASKCYIFSYVCFDYVRAFFYHFSKPAKQIAEQKQQRHCGKLVQAKAGMKTLLLRKGSELGPPFLVDSFRDETTSAY